MERMLKMDFGYIVRGKFMGDPYKSQIFDDAQDCDDEFYKCNTNEGFSDLKIYNAYVHYEEQADDNDGYSLNQIDALRDFKD